MHVCSCGGVGLFVVVAVGYVPCHCFPMVYCVNARGWFSSHCSQLKWRVYCALLQRLTVLHRDWQRLTVLRIIGCGEGGTEIDCGTEIWLTLVQKLTVVQYRDWLWYRDLTDSGTEIDCEIDLLTVVLRFDCDTEIEIDGLTVYRDWLWYWIYSWLRLSYWGFRREVVSSLCSVACWKWIVVQRAEEVGV